MAKLVYMSGLGGTTSAITADTVFDGSEGCADWQLWHQAMKNKYGKTQADATFLHYVTNLSSWNWNYSFCRYDCGTARYFAAEGIDIGDVVSHTYCGIDKIVGNTVNVVDNTTGGVATATSTLAKVLPIAIVLGVGGLLYYGYKTYLKPKSKIAGKKWKR